MKNFGRQNGFSTMELVTVIAILVILASSLIKIAKSIKTQAEERLARGQIDIIATALEQYYKDNDGFPFEADPIAPGDDPDLDFTYDQAELEADTGGTVDLASGAHQDEYSSSEAIFYFLDRSPNSSKIIGAMSNTLISNKDQSGDPLKIIIGTDPFSLVRFIDPWGKSLRYTYVDGDTFPVVESAGLDGKFYTDGDNISSR